MKKDLRPGDVAWFVRVTNKKIHVEHVFIDSINQHTALVIDSKFDNSFNCNEDDLFLTMSEAIKEMDNRLEKL